MDMIINYVREYIVNFKLDKCCFIVAPVRLGLLITAYFHLALSMAYMLGTSNKIFPPTLMKIQDKIYEESSTSMCVIAYSVEMGFSVLLLCAIHRNNRYLLRVYLVYTLISIATSVIFYSLVYIVLDVLYRIIILSSLVFQCYECILVKSLITELKEIKVENSNSGESPHKNQAEDCVSLSQLLKKHGEEVSQENGAVPSISPKQTSSPDENEANKDIENETYSYIDNTDENTYNHKNEEDSKRGTVKGLMQKYIHINDNLKNENHKPIFQKMQKTKPKNLNIEEGDKDVQESPTVINETTVEIHACNENEATTFKNTIKNNNNDQVAPARPRRSIFTRIRRKKVGLKDDV